MFYLAYKPPAPLAAFVRSLWYCRAPQLDYARQRILPSGCAQIILNLSRDFLIECRHDSTADHFAASILVGQRSAFEIVDTSDFADLIGVLFEPAALPAFVPDRADLCSNQNFALEDVWGRNAALLRDSLLVLETPRERLASLEKFLFAKLRPSGALPLVQFALQRFHAVPAIASVEQVARESGSSVRRFSQVFREHVGFVPKTWCRLQRLQRTVTQLSTGSSVRWAELALDCGYYDQSHLANDFHSFSGIDLTTYCRARNPLWPNHARVD